MIIIIIAIILIVTIIIILTTIITIIVIKHFGVVAILELHNKVVCIGLDLAVQTP
jgi:hypothetical protein